MMQHNSSLRVGNPHEEMELILDLKETQGAERTSSRGRGQNEKGGGDTTESGQKRHLPAYLGKE